MNKLSKVLDFCIRHQTALGYGTVSLLTAGMEEIFSSVVFKCPCNSKNTIYGSVFLIVPAFILFLLGYMVNTRIWLLLTGSCTQESCSCNFWENCKHYCEVLVKVTARNLVAPLTWIAVALLSTDFYECAASGSSFWKKRVCKDKGTKCYELLVNIPCGGELPVNETFSLQAESQLIGWVLIASIVTMALFFKCVYNCCSSVAYFQQKFWKMYLKQEREQFDTKAAEHARHLAERNITCFFETTDPSPFQTPSNEDWRKISSLHTFSSQQEYYSMIHKYANTQKDSRVRGREGAQNPPILGFVARASERESEF
ncbi:calcium homeostasis modulator protein 6 [Colius striatus]|uniref:calcium homeostasis modulator protein 6 n=1 Tax=Colius striatus TaxID=57412 RepID=UPI002B1E8B6A|nr:calcium homeostasis modulator protein 6 [Colius striatus]